MALGRLCTTMLALDLVLGGLSTLSLEFELPELQPGATLCSCLSIHCQVTIRMAGLRQNLLPAAVNPVNLVSKYLSPLPRFARVHHDVRMIKLARLAPAFVECTVFLHNSNGILASKNR